MSLTEEVGAEPNSLPINGNPSSLKPVPSPIRQSTACGEYRRTEKGKSPQNPPSAINSVNGFDAGTAQNAWAPNAHRKTEN